MITSCAPEGFGPPPSVRAELDVLERRVARRLEEAPRTGPGPGRPVLSLIGALLLAHDLHLLGVLAEPPSLRWRVADAARALAAWQVDVVADLPARCEPAVTEGRVT